MRLHRAAIATAVTALGIGVAGCGVGGQSDPVRLDADRVPFGLVGTASTTTTAPVVEGIDERVAARVFLLGPDDLLLARERALPSPLTPGAVLRALRAGPDRAERQAGITTALPAEIPVQFLGSRDGVARVRLSPAFTDGSVRRQASALAEIVYTLTDLPGIERVSFLVDEEVVEVPRGDGSLTADPVGRADYARFAPPG
jgi:hypothetical protein